MIIVPFVGLGPLKFGMGKADVAALLPEELIPSQKTMSRPDILCLVTLQSHDMFLFFDSEGGLEYVEMYEPRRPEWNGVSFLADDLAHISLTLAKQGHMIYDDGFHFRIPSLGVSFGVDEDDEMPARLAGVSVHRKGYYESYGFPLNTSLEPIMW